MDIILLSSWLEIVSGTVVMLSYDPKESSGRGLPLSFFQSSIKENVFSAQLLEGKWYGHVQELEIIEKQTFEKRKFDAALINPFTVTAEDIRVGAKELSLEPLYELEIDIPEDRAGADRSVEVLGRDRPATLAYPIGPGPRRLMLLSPEGTLQCSLLGPTWSDRTVRLIELEGHERLRLVSFVN